MSKTAEEKILKGLIEKHLEFKTGLETTSIEYYAEYGKVSGSMYLNVKRLCEEYAKLKISKLELTQVPVGDDTPLSRCLKRISELEKEVKELKRELARYEIHDLKRK